jgi:NADH dehydrogenase [ubiquinone] 1 alpha subcomplex assembly factor 7
MIEQIKELGELSIPSYWKQALTDDIYGYYRQSNVFSKEGDFTTSPEISTLFGEMVATWLVVFLQTPAVKVLNPFTNSVEKPFRLVELGGGRGMLMQDILRSFRSYNINNHFELCFI